MGNQDLPDIRIHPRPQACANVLYSYVPLCVGRSKGKAGLQLECIPEKRDINKL